jgi:Glycosyl transferase family 2
VISAYNEGDILYHSLRKLIDQGIGVHLIDNWSTDDSFEQIQPLIGHGIIAYEKYPHDGPTPYFSLRKLLRRTEQVIQASQAEWVIHQDVDEIRCSPWPGVTLRESLERVAREGYNTVDHAVLRFRPIDNSFPYGGDMELYFKWFTFDRHPALMQQRKAWRRLGGSFSLAATCGHDVHFEGQKVFPTRFLLKHYPVRSQKHGFRKVLRERKPRFDPEERALGWHVHYDGVDASTNFLADPATLERYSPFLTRKRLLDHPLEPDANASFL